MGEEKEKKPLSVLPARAWTGQELGNRQAQVTVRIPGETRERLRARVDTVTLATTSEPTTVIIQHLQGWGAEVGG